MPDLTKLHFAGHARQPDPPCRRAGQHPVGVLRRCRCASNASSAPGSRCRTRDRTAARRRPARTARARPHRRARRPGVEPAAQIPRRVRPAQRCTTTGACCPAACSFHRLIPIVRNYAGDTLLWDVNLILKARKCRRLQLGRQGRLGWTTWLMPRRTARTTRRTCFSTPAPTAWRSRSTRNTDAFTRRARERTHDRNQPRRAVRQAQPARLQGDRGGDGLLQAARQSRMSSWCTGCTRSCRHQDSDLHRIVRHFELDAVEAGGRHHRRAGPAAARRHLDLRFLPADRGSRRARLGVRAR